MKILITGASNGMGKGVARVLAAADKNHELILVCRSKANGEAAVHDIEQSNGNSRTTLVICDLAKLHDVKEAVSEIRRQTYLDAVFINAGLGYARERRETEDGLDSHFQVNYLSQFMLTLNLLPLLEKSRTGGRVIFNATNYGDIQWDDMQMKHGWSYERGIFQAMAAKRMFLHKLHSLYSKMNSPVSFVGFQIHKTVWSNQLNIIPPFMKFMAHVVKFFGGFISIDACGREMAPLFLEDQKESMNKSGKLITWKKNAFCEIVENADILNDASQDRLWELSLDLCGDAETRRIAEELLRRQ